MTKDEFFEKNYEDLKTEYVAEGFCGDTICEECYYKGGNCQDFHKDWLAFQRKKKLAKLLS